MTLSTKFKMSRRVHLMCQIYSSLLVKNCWTHQSVQKHFLLIRCWIPELKSRNSHKGQWGSKPVVFESVHWFLDSTLFWNRYLVLLQTWMFFKEYCETYYKFMFKRWFVCTQKILSQSINSISRIRRPAKRNSKWCRLFEDNYSKTKKNWCAPLFLSQEGSKQSLLGGPDR